MKVGDKVWYIPGYANEYLIAIQVTLQEQDSDGDGWWVDEPVGHSLSDDDLYLTREVAEIELRRRMADMKDEPAYTPGTLSAWRQSAKAFIVSTWEANGVSHPGFPHYTDKVKDVDWFNLTSA